MGWVDGGCRRGEGKPFTCKRKGEVLIRNLIKSMVNMDGPLDWRAGRKEGQAKAF